MISERWSQLVLEWLGIFLILCLLMYTMLIIKNEKSYYLRSGKRIGFSSFIFIVPPWWSIADQTESHLKFIRSDTLYDWMAIFLWRDLTTPENHKKLDLAELKQSFLLELSIMMDPEACHSNLQDVELPHLQNHFQVQDLQRIEGTGTRDETDRIYLDALFLVPNNLNGVLIAYSLSSVLNGSVEGPYFEEVMDRLQIYKDHDLQIDKGERGFSKPAEGRYNS